MNFYSLKYSTAYFLNDVRHNMKVPGPSPALMKSRMKIYINFKKTGSGFVILK